MRPFVRLEVITGAKTPHPGQDVRREGFDFGIELLRRNDLIPNLVSTVKGYASHEEKVFRDVSDARSRLAGAKTVAEASQANGELGNALSRLLAISEAYPELKANTNFIRLQDELAGTENRIAVARRDYNAAGQAD